MRFGAHRADYFIEFTCYPKNTENVYPRRILFECRFFYLEYKTFNYNSLESLPFKENINRLKIKISLDGTSLNYFRNDKYNIIYYLDKLISKGENYYTN